MRRAQCARPLSKFAEKERNLTDDRKNEPTSERFAAGAKLIASGKDPSTREDYELFACVARSSGKRKQVLIPVSAGLDGGAASSRSCTRPACAS